MTDFLFALLSVDKVVFKTVPIRNMGKPNNVRKEQEPTFSLSHLWNYFNVYIRQKLFAEII